jgi:hypothetical protein
MDEEYCEVCTNELDATDSSISFCDCNYSLCLWWAFFELSTELRAVLLAQIMQILCVLLLQYSAKTLGLYGMDWTS